MNLLFARFPSTQGTAEVYQAEFLTSAHQVIPEWLVSDSVSGRAKAVMKSVW